MTSEVIRAHLRDLSEVPPRLNSRLLPGTPRRPAALGSTSRQRRSFFSDAAFTTQSRAKAP